MNPAAAYSQQFGINLAEQPELTAFLDAMASGNAKLQISPVQNFSGGEGEFSIENVPMIGGKRATPNANGTYTVQLPDPVHGGQASAIVTVDPATGNASLIQSPAALQYSPGQGGGFASSLAQLAKSVAPLAAAAGAMYFGPMLFGGEAVAPAAAEAASSGGSGVLGAPAMSPTGAVSGAIQSALPLSPELMSPAVYTNAPLVGADLASATTVGGASLAPTVGAGTDLATAASALVDAAGSAGTIATGLTAAEKAALAAKGISTLGQALGKGVSAAGVGAQSDIVSGAAQKSLEAEQAILQPRIAAGQQGVNALQTGLAPGGQYTTPLVSPTTNALATGLAPGGQYATPFTMAEAQNTPAMQEALRSGQDIIQTGAAAKGGLLGTNALTGLTKFGQATGAQYEQQAFDQWLQNRNQQLGAQSNLAQLTQADQSRAMAERNQQLGAQTTLSNIGAQPTQTLATVAGNVPIVQGGAQAQATGAKYDMAGNTISNIGTGIEALSTASNALSKGTDFLTKLFS